MNRPILIAFTFLLFALFILWNQQASADTLWPTYRRDQTRNGISPLRGDMPKVPKVLWSIDLGGRQTTAEQIQFSDLDGDGIPDQEDDDADAVDGHRGEELGPCAAAHRDLGEHQGATDGADGKRRMQEPEAAGTQMQDVGGEYRKEGRGTT